MSVKVDTYRHLNDSDRDGAVIGIEQIAGQVVHLNYGVHRLLSAIIRHRRDKNAFDYAREKSREGKDWMLEDELVDGLEALLNRGLY